MSKRPARSALRTAFDVIRLSFAILVATTVAAPSSFAAAGDSRPAPTLGHGFERLPASARTLAVFEEEVPQLAATLVVAPEPPARVGVVFDLAPGWHLYWRNPGETGVAPEFEVSADGHSAGPIEWPVPTTFREADDLFTTYGYEGRVLLAVPLTPDGAGSPADASRPSAERARGTESGARVRVEGTVLVCRTQCVPASFSLASPLVPATSEADRASIASLFRTTRERLPREATAIGWRVDAAWDAASPAIDATGAITLTLDPCPSDRARCPSLEPGQDAAAFLPFEGDVFEFEPESRLSSPISTGPIRLVLAATRLETGSDRLRGVVRLRERDGRLLHAEIDVPIRAGEAAGGPAMGATSSTGPTDAVSPLALIHVVLLALLGGFILNGMPCVLPVLAIKIVSVADLAERDPREVRLHGLAYTAGVLGSMLVLALFVVALRAAGHAVGWGFQFQEPLFVAGIAALLVAFALNLFGVFEIELGQGRLAAVGQEATGLSRSAFEGLLAVVLATPCTAPFLGTAVGLAFASSGLFVVAIFLAIGVGLAFPFLIVSFFPALARLVPRSGPWMLKLRAGLGFCLLATVVWLLWIVGQSAGTDALVSLMAALLFLGFLLWVFGQMQPMRSPWLARASAIAIAGVAFGSFNLIEFEPSAAAAAQTGSVSPDAESGFLAYDEVAVRETLARGVPAFVVFTADWCITCKVNERTVLDRPAVREALARAGYALFKADWTRRDDTIRTKLAEFGRAGVPLYLVYDPARPDEPEVLSELLTEEAVVAALAPNTRIGAR